MVGAEGLQGWFPGRLEEAFEVRPGDFLCSTTRRLPEIVRTRPVRAGRDLVVTVFVQFVEGLDDRGIGLVESQSVVQLLCKTCRGILA